MFISSINQRKTASNNPNITEAKMENDKLNMAEKFLRGKIENWQRKIRKKGKIKNSNDYVNE